MRSRLVFGLLLGLLAFFVLIFLKELRLALPDPMAWMTVYRPPGVPEVSPDWRQRLWVGLYLVLIWGSVLFGFHRRLRSSGVIHPFVNLVGAAGLGTLLVLLVNVVVSTSFVTSGLLIWSAMLFIFFQAKPFRSISLGARFQKRSLLVLALLFVLWQAAYRGEAFKDEVSFWWTSIQAMFGTSFEGYFTTHPRASYYPAYPILSSWFLAPLPSSLFLIGSMFFPVFLGTILLGLLWMSPRLRVSTWGVGLVLVLGNSWIRTLWFQGFLGESLSVLILLSVLLWFRAKEGIQETLMLWTGAGLGALAYLHKPPLQTLLFVAVIPLLFACALLDPRNRRIQITKVVSFSGGAFLARALWLMHLHRHGLEAYQTYAKGWREFLHWDLSVITTSVIPYLYASWKLIWVPVLLTWPIAMMLRRPARVRSALLLSGGLMAAIFVLYASVWTKIEPESSGRYLLHGGYAWLIYFLVTQGRLLSWSLRKARNGFKLRSKS